MVSCGKTKEKRMGSENNKLTFSIQEEIVRNYPALRIGVVVARGIENPHEQPELSKFKAKLESTFRERYVPEDINIHPAILAWRETYRSFGTNPKDHRPTAEALLRRIVRGNNAPTINAAVNCYLLAELEWFLPVGGYDLVQLDGDLSLRFSKGGELFHPLGGGDPEATQEGEVVYVDRAKVLTRRWNYKDSDAAKITENSRDIALFTEAASSAITDEAVQGSANLIGEYLSRFCGGNVKTFVVSVQDGHSWVL